MTKQDNQVQTVGTQELTDDVYNNLVEQYRKIMVIGVDGENYVVRYPNKIEWKAISKFGKEGLSTGRLVMTDRAQSQLEDCVKSLIVFPSPEVFDEAEEFDGGLLTQITTTFLGAYASRTEEKKR